jgi:hypothetical protein
MFEVSGRTLTVGPGAHLLDYEAMDVVSLLVHTVDSGDEPLAYNGTLRIRIGDENDPPTDIVLDSTEVGIY